MLRHLMTSFAVASRAIHAWNVSRVQISIQIYAFDSDVHCKNAFCFLKIITHLYHLIAQVQSLCWDCIDICDAFSVLFPSLISLIFVILRYCDAICLLKSLWRRKCVVCVSTVSSHLLEWKHSEVLFSWWRVSEKWRD